jgi:hypothetical protein
LKESTYERNLSGAGSEVPKQYDSGTKSALEM